MGCAEGRFGLWRISTEHHEKFNGVFSEMVINAESLTSISLDSVLFQLAMNYNRVLGPFKNKFTGE